MSELADEVIIRRVVEGDTQAFNAVIVKYQDRVFRYVYSTLGNYDDALEATQDIFITVFQSLAKFRGESKFSTWLYSITSNYCKNYKRKKRRYSLVSIFNKDEQGETELPIVDLRENPERKVEMDSSLEIANEELAKLPEDYKKILVLRDIEGYSYDDIAEILGISLANVKVRIHRGRAMLKQKLGERGIV